MSNEQYLENDRRLGTCPQCEAHPVELFLHGVESRLGEPMYVCVTCLLAWQKEREEVLRKAQEAAGDVYYVVGSMNLDELRQYVGRTMLAHMQEDRLTDLDTKYINRWRGED